MDPRLRGAARVVVLVLLAALAVPAAVRAAESGAREHLVALERESFAANADKSVVQVRDAIFHQDITIDFQGKTLGTAMPGDSVLVDGEDLELVGVTHRLLDAAFAVDAKTLAERPTETSFTVADAITHRPLRVELGDTTLGALTSGHLVNIDGRPHVIWGVEQSLSGSLFLADAAQVDPQTVQRVIEAIAVLQGDRAFAVALFAIKQHTNASNGSTGD